MMKAALRRRAGYFACGCGGMCWLLVVVDLWSVALRGNSQAESIQHWALRKIRVPHDVGTLDLLECEDEK